MEEGARRRGSEGGREGWKEQRRTEEGVKRMKGAMEGQGGMEGGEVVGSKEERE